MNPQRPSEPLNKSCDACRAHKVRCLPNQSSVTKICQRCFRTDRQCVYTPPQKRKQRKRTDTRVAELEKEVSAMKALFDVQKSHRPEIFNPDTGLAASTSESSNTLSDTILSVTPAPALMDMDGVDFSTLGLHSWTTPPNSSSSDVIDRGIVSMDEAEQLSHSYSNDLVEFYPAVQIPAHIDVLEFRKSKPTLFLAIIAAAAAKSDPQLYSLLHSEVLSDYAHRTLVCGEKSLELVQAMIVTSVWYFPPGKLAQLKFYEYIHMAVVMALDIGLGTSPDTSRNRQRVGHDTVAELLLEDDAAKNLEEKRTFLVCYMISTGVSMSTRRPNMLRWSDRVEECLDEVSKNSHNSDLDAVLVAWVKLQKIGEEFFAAFSFDNPNTVSNLSESRTQIMMSGFEKSLEVWRRTHNHECTNDALMLQYHHLQLYLHELALHDDHSPQDFQPPVRLERVLSVQLDSKASLSHSNSVAICISSSHSLLDILLGMDAATIRALPIVNFVRMAYSFVILIKIYISTKTPRSHIGAAVDRGQLKLDFYLQGLIDKSVEAAGLEEFRAPYTFLGMLLRFQIWFKSQEADEIFTPPDMSSFGGASWLPPVQPIYPRKAESANAADTQYSSLLSAMPIDPQSSSPAQETEQMDPLEYARTGEQTSQGYLDADIDPSSMVSGLSLDHSIDFDWLSGTYMDLEDMSGFDEMANSFIWNSHLG